MKGHDALTSSASVEWYTPDWLLDLSRQVLGDIDLDPASCAQANENVRATSFYDQYTDGLAHDWHGRVWLNPPYGSGIGHWIRHLDEQFRLGHIQKALALVPARTGTKWWRRVAHYPVCFLRGRVCFIGAAEHGATFDSAVIYLGYDHETFERVFDARGACYRPVQPAARVAVQLLLA